MVKTKAKVSMGRRLLSVLLAILMVTTTLLSTGIPVFAKDLSSSDGYTVTISAEDNGKVSFDDTKKASKDFDVGDVVTVNTEPDVGYVVDTVTASFEKQGIDYQLSVSDNRAAFEMPEEDVNVNVTFREATGEDGILGADIPVTVEEENEQRVQSTEDYILKHADKKYVGEGDTLIPIDVATLTTTVAEGNKLPKDNKTIDALWQLDDDGDGVADNCDAFVTQMNNHNLGYVLGLDADYYAVYVGGIKSEEMSLSDVLAGQNDASGVTYDDIIVDYDDEIVYVPLKYCAISDDGEHRILGSVRIQVLYTTDDDFDFTDVKSDINVIVNATNVSGDVIETGVVETSLYAGCVSLEVARDDKSRESLKSIDSVVVNGEDMTEFTDLWSYDKETGILTVMLNSTAIDTIELNVSGDSSGVLGAITAYAAYSNDINTYSDRPSKGAKKVDGLESLNTKSCPWVIQGMEVGDSIWLKKYYVCQDVGGNPRFVNASLSTGVAGNSINDSVVKYLCEALYYDSKFDEAVAAGNVTKGGSTVNVSKLINMGMDSSDQSANWQWYGGVNGGVDYNGHWEAHAQNQWVYIMPGSDVAQDKYATVAVPKNKGGMNVKPAPDTYIGMPDGLANGDFGGYGANLFCSHIAIDGGEDLDNHTVTNSNGVDNVRMRVLQINNDGTAIVSINTPTISDQAGVGVFKLYIEESNGDLEIHKKSSNTNWTDGNTSGYGKLSEAKFTITGPTNVSGVTAKSYDVPWNSSKNCYYRDDLPVGTYTLAESDAPDGYNVSSTRTIKIESADTTSVDVVETVQSTSVNLKKITASGDTCLTDGNSSYSLENAVFTLKQTGATHNHSYTLTTDKNGEASTGNIPRGTYVLTEIQAPPGYDLNTELAKGKTFVLTKSSESITVEDPPFYDPLYGLIKKEDSDFVGTPSGGATLEGAEFTVRIFDDVEGTKTDADIKAGKYDGQEMVRFVIRTDAAGYAYSNKDHIVESSFYAKNGHAYNEWFDNNDVFRYPFGTIYVTETKGPAGYAWDDVPISTEASVKEFVEVSNNSAVVHWTREAQTKVDHLSVLVTNMFEVVDEHRLAGGVSIRKADNQSHESWGQGDAELAATFSIYNASPNAIMYNGEKKEPGAFLLSITADESNDYIASTGNYELPYGTYRIVETGTSADYNSSHYTHVIDIHPSVEEDGKMYDLTDKDFAENPPKRGGVSLTKFTQDFFAAEPEGDATLAGAEFTVYNQSKNPVYDLEDNPYEVGDAVVTIKTNDNGFATTGSDYLPIGTYTIKETKASSGYNLNETWEKTFKVTYEGEVIEYGTIPSSSSNVDFSANDANDKAAVGESVIRGGVKIYKSDKDRVTTAPQGDENQPQGDASLKDAHFIVINKSTHKVKVNGQVFEPGQICMTLHTNEQGIAETAADALPYGTYLIREAGKETALSSPMGYFVDSEWEATIYIREEGKIVEANDYVVNPVKEQIYRGGFKFLKIDAERNENIPQGDATLEGALFHVINTSATDVYVNGKWYAPNEVCYTFTTDKDGYYESPNDALPYGSYRIIEKAPSTGYLLNEDYYLDFQIRQNHKVYDLTGTPCGEYVIRGDVQIVKYDKELDKSEAIGGKDHGNNEYGTDLNGIKLDIVNRSKELVIVDGVRYEPGEVCKTIITHWNEELNAYTAETTGRALPYGTYDIYEVKSELSTDNDDKANEYYMRSDAVLTFQIREDGKTVTQDVDGNDLIFKNQVLRGDIEFRKIADGTSARMNTAWVVTNNTTGERHVIVADQNGEFYSASSRVRHTTGTNCNDKMLEKIDSGERLNMSEFTQRNKQGVWFGVGEFNSMAEPNDDLCALPYGQYTLSEVPTNTNEGYGLQEFVFYIYENNQVVDLGTITDDPIEIETELIDEETDGHVALAQADTLLTDTVTYKGLTKDRDYTMSGRLVDAETGAVVATGSTDFKAKSSGKVEVAYNFDAREWAGHNVVAFETVIDKTTGYKVAEHADITDTDQTVSFPEISTSAVSNVTSDHDAPALDKVVITDTISYSNVVAKKKYTVTGTLMNKTTGDEVFGADGRAITATATFTANDTSGTVTLDFTFDASALAGQTVVVFEELEYKKNVIAVHQDINDTEQTIYIPQISTSAVFEATGTDEGAPMENAVIVDTVSYKNLLTDKEYKLVGKLMDKDTGEVLKDADGKEVTAEKLFVPSTADGTIDVAFNFNATNMAGKTVVAYETLVRNDIEMAVHQDIDDEAQTVRFPWIGTTANYMDTDIHEALASDKVVVTDHVEYKALKAGSEYVMTGTLMDKATGSAIVDTDGKAVTTEIKFTPEKTDGTVDVVFELDASALAGHTVVAFESLKHNDIEVAIHNEIEDEDQSIHFAKIGTTLVEKETGLDEVQADKEYTFVDTIEYENLIAGHEYDVESVLVDKETGKEIGKSVQTKFTAKAADGVITVEIPFDAKDMANKSVVAYETISYKGTVIAEHKDVEDAQQTVTIPEIGTIATSELSGDNEGILANDYKLVDTVEYKNLVPGRSYVMTGTLMDKETGEALVDTDGNPITVQQGFTPEEKDGKVEVKFILDSTQLGGKDIVVFETLTREDVVLAEHKDIEDESQTIHFPAIGTNAFYGETTINEGIANETVTIKDTVSYKNLRVGEEYTVTGTLMDKATGEPITIETADAKADVTENADGTVEADVSATSETKYVTAETTFTPKEADGTVDVVFEFDATAFAGKTVVAFESLVRKDVERATHNDITDEAQSVHFPEISTTFTDKETGIHEVLADKEVTLTDTVDYKNLVAGNTYTATGTLMDKETGEAVKDADGKVITATAEFTPETADGSVVLEFTFDATSLKGKTVVAFEEVTRDGFVVAEHKDIEDTAQTVYFPEITTNAVDKTTGTHMMVEADTITITDTVSYSNLQAGQEYVLTGTLMDKDTGKPVELQNEVKTEGEKSEETAEETPAEEPTDSEEPTDEISAEGAQTEAVETEETEKTEDNESANVSATAVFTAEESTGTATVEFVLSNKDLAGKSFVVFETLSVNGVPVAEHNDMDDENQTVHMMSVDTKATGEDGRSKTVDISAQAKVIDTIEYKNLVPGVEYSVAGKLVYKDSGEVAKTSDGKDAAVTAKFTPEKADGSVNVEFTVDTTKDNGKTLVVFENIYDNDVQIGSHADIDDKDQSVTVKTVTTLKTGITNIAGIMAILAIVAVLAVIGILIYRKRKANKNLLNG